MKRQNFAPLQSQAPLLPLDCERSIFQSLARPFHGRLAHIGADNLHPLLVTRAENLLAQPPR